MAQRNRPTKTVEPPRRRAPKLGLVTPPAAGPVPTKAGPAASDTGGAGRVGPSPPPGGAPMGASRPAAKSPRAASGATKASLDASFAKVISPSPAATPHSILAAPIAAADTLKGAVDQYASAGAGAFKGALEKSLSALTEANGYSTRNLEAVIAAATAATKGAESLGSQAVAFSHASFETQVAAAKSLSAATSILEVIDLQTTYARRARETYLAAMRSMSEIAAASVKDSLKPLRERVTTAVGGPQALR